MARVVRRLLTIQMAATLLWSLLAALPAAASHGGPHLASGWTFAKWTVGPACNAGAFADPGYIYWDRNDCGFGEVQVGNTQAGDAVTVRLLGPDGTPIGADLSAARQNDDGAWRYTIDPDGTWPAGVITARIVEVTSGANPPESGNFGEATFFLNQLGATVGATGGPFAPGDPIPFSGEVFEQDNVPPLLAPQTLGVAATVNVRVIWPDGTVKGPFGPFTAAADGMFGDTIPGSATEDLTPGADTGFQATVQLQVVEAEYTDPTSGAWAAEEAGSGLASVFLAPSGLQLENSFVSSVGWVKPGEAYPFRVLVRNFTASAATNVEVTIPEPDGTTFTQATTSDGTVSTPPGTITWTIGTSPAAAGTTPSIQTLIVEAEADTTNEDPQVVWKDLSSTASLTSDAGPATDTSHGPKVIPERATYDTARYGDRPFPVVPVDYFDRKHDEGHTGQALATKINAPDYPGSTFNLFQEMSYGQLFPHAAVPSAGIGSAGWDAGWTGESGQYSGDAFEFTQPSPNGVCHGATFPEVAPVVSERISGGWYQLPGNTDYYGDDTAAEGTALSAVAGLPRVGDIDNGCGPTGKSVYDAAHIADPEIDYNDYDTDKDGVVDFFMMVFVGIGGNGESQTSAPPYDNIWPHSSSLETGYRDPETGLRGYISDDQLTDLEGVPQCYLDDNYAQFDDCTANGGSGDDELPVPVRVGPYNVNPETAIDHASVISHEYGHSLGLPDYYSTTDGRDTYGTWNLMATDYSQNMDLHARQEMGWVIPEVLEAGQTETATNWPDSKTDTHEIHWVEPDGDPYTLSGPEVHNGRAYVAKLPPRIIIDPDKFNPEPGEGATAPHTWWSGSGNDFGCSPDAGHNFDVYLPDLAGVPAGTDVTLTFKSYWDIEWDYDYGFVLLSTDNGETYASQESANGYTTPGAVNPNAIGCQTQYGNGITGSSGSYAAGTFASDRTPLVDAYPDGGFISDEYDISEAAGRPSVLRFSYSTDAGLAHPGWFIDDLTVTAGDEVLFETDFESSGGPTDARVFNGGCSGTTTVATRCTPGWIYVDASEDNPADHAYYMEMRDRSGFDADSHGEADRAPGQPTFDPGLSLVYVDEGHGYGNSGVNNPPAQHILDSQPQPGEAVPDLDDAAWTDADGDSHFSDAGEGHTDNYEDPANAEVDSRYPDVANPWRFRYDCLTFDVQQMSGEDVGPVTAPGNLEGDVDIQAGPGCAPFDFGHAGGPDLANLAPTALIEVRPKNPKVGQRVTFDGSRSSDDKQAPTALSYAWDFDGDGTFEGQGRSTQHAYDLPGVYQAQLKVTDAGGLTGLDSVPIVVTGCPKAPEGSNQITGTDGPDVLVGTDGADVICGAGGRDRIRGGGGDDVIVGGTGKDKLRGNSGVDILAGDRANDRLSGGGGGDRLLGGPGRDRLRGGPGRDQLLGGPGRDEVIGPKR